MRIRHKNAFAVALMKHDEVAFEDFSQQRFFAVEEGIETARVHLGVGQQVNHRSAGESPVPRNQ